MTAAGGSRGGWKKPMASRGHATAMPTAFVSMYS
jgi:hypothetical protein